MDLKRSQFVRAVVLTTAIACELFACLGTSRAADYFVSSAADISNTLQNMAGPGDTLIMTDGTWTDQQIDFSAFGTSSDPITLRAETPGQVILNGNSTLSMGGNWLVVDGLRFEGGALAHNSDAIVQFRDSSNFPAFNSRFTNSAIINYNAANVDDRYHWVEIFGQNNRVDNNRFEGQNHSGVTVVVRRDNATAQHHVISGNHFVDRPQPINPSSTNGFESIRVGTSSQSLSDSFTTVENNLFERTDGEIEIISNKSGNNTFQYNTFRNSEGTLTLRHGNDTMVKGNFFLGENNSRSGAIRVIGERQTIVNNYIANVDDRAGGAISISAGVPNSGLNEYYQVKDAVIAHNTLVNTTGRMVTFDDGLGSSGRTLLAENVTFANNILRSSGTDIFEGNEGSGWTWEGNIAFGGSLGPKAGDTGITVVDPDLQLDSEGLWRPSGTSPAIDSATSTSGGITDDMDGQARVGLFDVGADEFSVATIVRKPLVADDVGPDWIGGGGGPVDPPSGGGCFANGCAIQAEDFSSIIDSDNNGVVWTTSSVTEAFGGEVLVAPNGSRVDLPGDTHDSIATYDMTFEQAGTYRAYYRARGANGSTDSIYVPDDFATDPDSQENLCRTDNGSCDHLGFRWEVGGLFTILPSHVDMPLEFRIGKREEMAELDALVLDLDHSLTPTELDTLFDIVFDPADFDEDGDVDADDLLAWQNGYGMTSGASRANGDADQDGDVDANDFLAWQRQFTGSAQLSALSIQVPEPSSATLLTLCCMTLFRRNRFRQTLESTL